MPMSHLTAALLADRSIAARPLSERLIPVLVEPTGITSAGYPYLRRVAWERFRDTVPHLFAAGQEVLKTADVVEAALEGAIEDPERRDDIRRACRVVRQVVRTAAITAPPDLWLLRHVLGFFSELGLLDRLLVGEAIYPESCEVEFEGVQRQLAPLELDTDVHFLLSRGLVEQYDDSFRIAGHPRVRDLLSVVGPTLLPGGVSGWWRRVFGGEGLDAPEVEGLLDWVGHSPQRTHWEQNHWIPTLEELEIGYHLVPVVLGLRATETTSGLVTGQVVAAEEWSPNHPRCACAAMEVLGAAGWLARCGERWQVTALGERSFARAPGPFGIIETYHGYMTSGMELLLHGAKDVWVSRSENIGASQDANRRTFARANDALDRFCSDTGFHYDVFVEHAMGRGEATRQRYQRSGDALCYFGADLEDPAIDGALDEQRAGALPADMVLVRHADIGRPETVVDAIRAHGSEPHGAVMVVGNGFHEVRDQSDQRMTDVFRGYQEAGLLILFTEETALSMDDLRATAWNTYHAGFKYVHEKSGQGLRPAEPGPTPRLGHPLRAAWSECAERAGYVRASRWCVRSRTIYPYPPPSGHNPSISVNHFFIPKDIAVRLGLVTVEGLAVQ